MLTSHDTNTQQETTENVTLRAVHFEPFNLKGETVLCQWNNLENTVK